MIKPFICCVLIIVCGHVDITWSASSSIMPKIDTVALKAHEQDQKKVSPCLCKDCQNCWSPRDKHPYSIEEKVVAVGLISTPLSEALIELVLDYYYDEWLEMNSQ